MLKSRVAALAATLIFPLSFAGCGGIGQAPPGTEPAPVQTESIEPLPEDPTTSDAAPSQEPGSPSEEPTDAQDEDPLYKFGQTATYDSGLQVTLGKLYTIKGFAYPDQVKKGEKVVAFKVTLNNRTNKRFDPTLFSMTGSTGDNEAEQVFDTDNDLGGSPSTKILRGKKRSWTVGFIVTKGEEFVIEARPNYDVEPVIFTS